MRLMNDDVVKLLREEAYTDWNATNCYKDDDEYNLARTELAREILNMMGIPYEKEENTPSPPSWIMP